MRSTIPLTRIVQLAAALSLFASVAQAQPGAKAQPQAKPAAAAPSCTVVGISRTPLLDVPLEGLKGMDGAMYITDIGPGLVAPRHSHPGYEFNYILKGSVSYQVDGQKPYTLKAGQGGFNKRGNIHKVWNPSKTEPAQLVAVLIKDADKGLAVCEK